MNAEQDETDDSIFKSTNTAPPLAPPAPNLAPAAKWENLSAEICATINREPGDRVKCTWISGDHYRCNWWAPENTRGFDNPAMTGLTVTTHRVRKSEFLKVTKSRDGLVIQNRSVRPSAGHRIF
jgi:hypothetical protein